MAGLPHISLTGGSMCICIKGSHYLVYMDLSDNVWADVILFMIYFLKQQ